MTRANQVTFLRIGLIPIFAALAAAYGRSVAAGRADEKLRRLAASVFLLAAVTDGLDGYLARHFDQKSRLGSILDPIADKGLMLVALTTLGAHRWDEEFPFWFPLVVIGRDSLLAIGYGLLTRLRGRVEVRPSLAGKGATGFQLLSILWTLLRIRGLNVRYLAAVASLLTVVSGLGYIYKGCFQVQHANVQSSR